MRLVKTGIILLGFFVLLGASACSRSVVTTIEQVAVATGVTADNVAETELTQVPSSSEAIYLSAQVSNPSRATTIQVRWYQLPSQLIAREDFSGRRTDVNRFDFNKQASDSFFASRIARDRLSWSLGEYRVEVFVNSKLAKTIFFNVISDAEAASQAVARLVTQVQFGDALNSQFRLAQDQTVFSRSTDTIYIQVDIKGAKPNTEIQTSIRYIKEDQVVASFVSEVVGDKELVLSLPRERFGRLWPDHLWPTGSFEVVVTINSIEAKTRTWLVK